MRVIVLMAGSIFASASQLVSAACASIDADTVVFVETYYEYGNGEQERYGTASGVLVRPQGYVLTAKHIQPATVPQGAQVLYYGTQRAREGTRYRLTPYPGPIIQGDAALFNFSSDVKEAWPFLEVDLSANINVGTQIAAWGFPLDRGRTRMEGYVTSLGGLNGTVQLDSNFAHGMSGAPVVSEQCKLIGIVAGGSQAVGFQFFTPYEHFLPLLAPFLQVSGATSAPADFPLCRHPAHGLEGWSHEEAWAADSGWVRGGNNPDAYCGGEKLRREVRFPDRTVRLLETGESHKSEYNPFKHDFYRYRCSFKDLWGPIFKEQRSANCLAK